MRLLVLCAGLWASTFAHAEEAPPADRRADFGRAQFGGAGLSRVRSATLMPDTASFSAHGGFFRQHGLTAPGAADEHHLALFGVTFTPRPWLELSASSRSVTHEQPAASARWAYLVNDILLRAKVGLPLQSGGLSLAVEGSLRIPPPVGRSIPLWEGLSPGLGGLLTYDFAPSGFPLRLHLNSGLLFDNSVDFDDEAQSPTRRFALFINTYNQWQSGAALEARFQFGELHLIPFLEYTVEVPLGGSGAPPMRLSPGLRILPWKGLVLDATVELGVQRGSVVGMNPAPGYLVLLGIGYQASFESSSRQVAERVVEHTLPLPTPPPQEANLSVALRKLPPPPLPLLSVRSATLGETRPLASNKSAQGRARNRRVEFMIEEPDSTRSTAAPAASVCLGERGDSAPCWN